MAEISIKVNGLDDTLHNLEHLSKDFAKVVDESLSNLTLEGRRIAQSQYALAPEGSQKPISVSKHKVNNCNYKLVASGESVYFVEFGAGEEVEDNEMSSGLGIDVSEGSWSKSHAGMYAEKGYWYYKKEQYDRVVPTHAMYQAKKHIKANLLKSIMEGIKIAK